MVARSVDVTDSSHGVLEGHCIRPFFTTKDVGKGAGWSCHVTTHVVEHHGGHLTRSRWYHRTRAVADAVLSTRKLSWG
jgi:nitrogen-specific signal transduction histidine kinase